MKVEKWNYEKGQYDEYTIPDDWNCKLYTDLDEVINCAACGKKIAFGESYTSLTIHGVMGFGYPVCAKCHQTELMKEKAYREQRRSH